MLINITPPTTLKSHNYNKLCCFHNLSTFLSKADLSWANKVQGTSFILHRPLASPATGLFFCHAVHPVQPDTATVTWKQDST